MLSIIKKNRSNFILLGIIMVGFFLRLYHLDFPLLDWHSFRQSDTASVTREFIKHNYPLWLPHYQDLGQTQSGLPNLEGYRFVEFPLINYGLAIFLRLCPNFNLVTISRLTSIFFSLGSIVLIYIFLNKIQKNRTLSLLAAGIFAILPFGAYYGRSILPEPFQVFFSLLTIVTFVYYLEKNNFTRWLLVCLSFAIALLIKPTSIFIAPVLLFLAWKEYSWSCFKHWELYLLAICSTAPLIWWRQFMLDYPSGIPASQWLLNGDGIRLRPAWWRWLFYERLTKMWLGYVGLIFFLVGLLPEKLLKFKQKINLTTFDLITWSYLLGMLLYLIIFATGNVRHDYYQVILLPIVVITYARGIIWFYRFFHQYFSAKIIISAILILNCLAFYFAVQENIGKFNVNNWAAAKLGQVADQLLPSNALVIADAFGGDTNFLFQTNRTGWPDGDNLNEKIAQGAQFYLTTNFDDRFQEISQTYSIIYQDENGAILDLQSPLSSTDESNQNLENP